MFLKNMPLYMNNYLQIYLIYRAIYQQKIYSNASIGFDYHS